MSARVYILYFNQTDKYYVGSTTDLERRLRQHRTGHTPTTKRLGCNPLLVFSQEVNSIAIARRAERKIKSWKRRDYIEKIISEDKIKFLE